MAVGGLLFCSLAVGTLAHVDSLQHNLDLDTPQGRMPERFITHFAMPDEMMPSWQGAAVPGDNSSHRIQPATSGFPVLHRAAQHADEPDRVAPDAGAALLYNF
jgi:hypothetical protein